MSCFGCSSSAEAALSLLAPSFLTGASCCCSGAFSESAIVLILLGFRFGSMNFPLASLIDLNFQSFYLVVVVGNLFFCPRFCFEMLLKQFKFLFFGAL